VPRIGYAGSAGFAALARYRLLLESPPSSAGFLIMGGKFAALT
jgi:hypothetical protein